MKYSWNDRGSEMKTAASQRSPRTAFPMQLWLILLVLMMINMHGCASVPKRNALPEEFYGMAEIPGMGGHGRFWGDKPPAGWEEDFLSITKAELKQRYAGVIRRKHNYLAISGGGANGAFGAGLLVGWTETGTRPEFTLVSGISTGALAAPFAFLGPAYDAQLKEIYTTYSTKDLIIKQNILTLLTGHSAASTRPLKGLIARHYDQELMEAIAAEYRKGRTLFIGTTDLDAGRPVIWDITRIAASGTTQSLELIQKIILASASVPGAFPPVFFEVEKDGQTYDEIHVDGGTASQVFLYPAGMNWKLISEHLEVKGKPSVYLIRNSFLEPDREIVEAKLASIVGRSISSLIRSQGIGDMYRIYLSAKHDDLDYNLAYIPSTFREEPEEIFDPVYMKKLFNIGYEMAKSGYSWNKAPPGFAPIKQSE
jgi:predicted patatin/cPLA2 family phospholipase